MPISGSLIRAYVDQGKMKVSPWNPKYAKGASLDVCLGEYYFRMSTLPCMRNMYDKSSADILWGLPQSAIPLREQNKHISNFLASTVKKDEKIILLHPHETILGHTHEFVAADKSLVGDIRGRSTIRRNGLTVSADGNWGDPGFKGRWTLFIHNESPHTIPLVVGRRITQIIFHEVTGLVEDYASEAGGGKYQSQLDFEELKRNWKPQMILPKMQEDREVDEVYTLDLR